MVDEILSLPPNLVQEGAGDFIWDESRQIFWAGYGPRSDKAAALWMGEAFDTEIVPLELATPQFYHLDTCFCPLSGGEVLYYPPAFTKASLSSIRERVAPVALIEADAEAAAGFCVNAVNIGRTIIMAKAPAELARQTDRLRLSRRRSGFVAVYPVRRRRFLPDAAARQRGVVRGLREFSGRYSLAPGNNGTSHVIFFRF